LAALATNLLEADVLVILTDQDGFFDRDPRLDPQAVLIREARALGYRKLSARPRHYAQDADAAETFKKTSPPRWRKSPRVPPKGE